MRKRQLESAGWVIDTVVCLTLAKWDTVSGRFGGCLRHDNHAGVRMRLSKIGPVAALALSGVGLWLLALAPFGWRMGWWQYAFGLYWMMPVSGLVAAVAVILSVLTLTRWWSELRLRDLVMLFIALVLGAALVYVPLQYWHTRSTFPPIHDITTDTASPPRFNAVLAARAAEGANDVEIGTRSSLRCKRPPTPIWCQS